MDRRDRLMWITNAIMIVGLIMMFAGYDYEWDSHTVISCLGVLVVASSLIYHLWHESHYGNPDIATQSDMAIRKAKIIALTKKYQDMLKKLEKYNSENKYDLYFEETNPKDNAEINSYRQVKGVIRKYIGFCNSYIQTRETLMQDVRVVADDLLKGEYKREKGIVLKRISKKNIRILKADIYIDRTYMKDINYIITLLSKDITAVEIYEALQSKDLILKEKVDIFKQSERLDLKEVKGWTVAGYKKSIEEEYNYPTNLDLFTTLELNPKYSLYKS